MDDYLIDSARTAANGVFHKELVPLNLLLAFIGARVERNKTVDACKKSLFYGRDPSDQMEQTLGQLYDGDSFDYTEHPDLIHGLLGIDTESAELLELLWECQVHGMDIDETKVRNELGDLLWYIALVCRHFGWTFEEVAFDNLEKLRRRYPEKFEARLALKRNESFENEVFA